MKLHEIYQLEKDNSLENIFLSSNEFRPLETFGANFRSKPASLRH